MGKLIETNPVRVSLETLLDFLLFLCRLSAPCTWGWEWLYMFHIDDLFHVILKGQSLDPTFLMQQPLPAMSKVTEFGNQLWDTSPVVSFSRKLDIPDVNWTFEMLDKKLLVTSPNWPRSDLQPFLKGSVWQSPGCPIRLDHCGGLMGRHEQLCVHAGLVVFHVFFQYRGTLFFQSPPFAKMQDNTRHFR